jgi:uncharacterized FlaG/YvyC family protein
MNVSSVQSVNSVAEAGGSNVTPQEASQRRDLVKAAQVINDSRQFGSNNELVFVFDRVTHHAIMRVVNKQTNEVVMQLPPDYVLKLAADVLQQQQRKASLSSGIAFSPSLLPELD